jgi:hypothetical protein
VEFKMFGRGISGGDIDKIVDAIHDRGYEVTREHRATDTPELDTIGKDPTKGHGLAGCIPFTTRSDIKKKLLYEKYGVKEGMGTGKKVLLGTLVGGTALAVGAVGLAMGGIVGYGANATQVEGATLGYGGLGYGGGGFL